MNPSGASSVCLAEVEQIIGGKIIPANDYADWRVWNDGKFQWLWDGKKMMYRACDGWFNSRSNTIATLEKDASVIEITDPAEKAAIIATLPKGGA